MEYTEGDVIFPIVTSSDLLSLGFEPGPHFSSILKNMYELQLKYELTSKESIIDIWNEKGRHGLWVGTNDV